MHTVREMLTPCLREFFGLLKSEPDIRSSLCLVTSFFKHLSPSPDLTSAFGGRRSIQLSYGCLRFRHGRHIKAGRGRPTQIILRPRGMASPCIDVKAAGRRRRQGRAGHDPYGPATSGRDTRRRACGDGPSPCERAAVSARRPQAAFLASASGRMERPSALNRCSDAGSAVSRTGVPRSTS